MFSSCCLFIFVYFIFNPHSLVCMNFDGFDNVLLYLLKISFIFFQLGFQLLVITVCSNNFGNSLIFCRQIELGLIVTSIHQLGMLMIWSENHFQRLWLGRCISIRPLLVIVLWNYQLSQYCIWAVLLTGQSPLNCLWCRLGKPSILFCCVIFQTEQSSHSAVRCWYSLSFSWITFKCFIPIISRISEFLACWDIILLLYFLFCYFQPSQTL